jgi:hypothetical protein
MHFLRPYTARAAVLLELKLEPKCDRVSCGVEGTPRDLHPILRDEVYWIAGEAVRNAFNHAHAQVIDVDGSFGCGCETTERESTQRFSVETGAPDTLACMECANGPS